MGIVIHEMQNKVEENAEDGELCGWKINKEMECDEVLGYHMN